MLFLPILAVLLCLHERLDVLALVLLLLQLFLHQHYVPLHVLDRHLLVILLGFLHLQDGRDVLPLRLLIQDLVLDLLPFLLLRQDIRNQLPVLPVQSLSVVAHVFYAGVIGSTSHLGLAGRYQGNWQHLSGITDHYLTLCSIDNDVGRCWYANLNSIYARSYKFYVYTDYL